MLVNLELINSSGGEGGGTVAKDALGNDVLAAEWLKTHGPGDRTLTQGLKVYCSRFFFVNVTCKVTIFPSLCRHKHLKSLARQLAKYWLELEEKVAYFPGEGVR